MTEKDKVRFLAKFKQGTPNECWEWQGSRIKKGYGNFWVNGKATLTHRVSYEIFKGKIPEGLCVLHTCDNPPCVNHNHLWLGTKKDNSIDCVKKGRHPDFSYEKNPCFGRTGEKHPSFGRTGVNAYNFGNNHSQKTLKIISESSRGENNPSAKLTEEQIKEIKNSNLKQTELAKIYGVRQGYISKIITGKNWRHVK